MYFLKKIIKSMVYRYTATSDSYIKYLRKIGVLIGEDVVIFDPHRTTIDNQNPHMLEIGNHVMMAGPVTIMTHDYSWSVLKYKYAYICGNQRKTSIGNNVFIGWGATILGGTTIGDNVIIGAGSVVKGNVESDSVYAGNPAKKIMSLENFYEKRKNKQLSEAVSYVLQYKKRWGVFPPQEEMDEYFYLFSTDTVNNLAFKKKLKLVGNEEKCILFLSRHTPTFTFESFIDYCERKQKNEDDDSTSGP